MDFRHKSLRDLSGERNGRVRWMGEGGGERGNGGRERDNGGKGEGGRRKED